MKTGLFLLSITLFFVISVFGWYVWYNEQDKESLRTNQVATENQPEKLFPNPSPTPNPPETTETGTITGSLSFPSEVMPPMVICAETTDSEEEFCTEEILTDDIYTNGSGYELNVPTGEYHVYASLPNDPYRAYYSEFVVCGLTVDCPSHEPIAVNIEPGEIIEGIDPQDWYNRSDDEQD